MDQKQIQNWMFDVHPEYTEEDFVRIAQEEDAYIDALIEANNSLPLVLTEPPDEDSLKT